LRSDNGQWLQERAQLKMSIGIRAITRIRASIDEPHSRAAVMRAERRRPQSYPADRPLDR
jgi:hypothetical protein